MAIIFNEGGIINEIFPELDNAHTYSSEAYSEFSELFNEFFLF